MEKLLLSHHLLYQSMTHQRPPHRLMSHQEYQERLYSALYKQIFFATNANTRYDIMNVIMIIMDFFIIISLIIILKNLNSFLSQIQKFDKFHFDSFILMPAASPVYWKGLSVPSFSLTFPKFWWFQLLKILIGQLSRQLDKILMISIERILRNFLCSVLFFKVWLSVKWQNKEKSPWNEGKPGNNYEVGWDKIIDLSLGEANKSRYWSSLFYFVLLN